MSDERIPKINRSDLAELSSVGFDLDPDGGKSFGRWRWNHSHRVSRRRIPRYVVQYGDRMEYVDDAIDDYYPGSPCPSVDWFFLLLRFFISFYQANGR